MVLVFVEEWVEGTLVSGCLESVADYKGFIDGHFLKIQAQL